MNPKERYYSGVARETIHRITANRENWTSFLATMARNYDFTYPEQVMIYAQRPNATLCKPYEEWNTEQYRRYVKRGSTGIALFVMNQDKPYLRYVFDVADTGVRLSSPAITPWRVTDENRRFVMDEMERVFQVPSEGILEYQLENIAINLAREYWDDFKKPILDIVADSFLEEYDEYNIEVAFKTAVANSVSYAMYSRITENPDNYFEHEDFQNVFDFNTRQTVNALGTAVNAVSSRMFGEIEKAIEAFEQTKTVERSHDYERNDLHTGRGLPDSGHRTEEHRNETVGQVRQNAEGVSAREQPDVAERPDSQRAAVPASPGDRRDSAPQSGAADDRTAGEESGTGQSDTADGMGAAHEQPESTGRGNRDSGAYQQLSLNLFLSESEQISFIDEAESKTLSAFSLSENQIDQVLTVGGNEPNLRMMVALEYMKGKSTEEIAKRLPELYRGSNGFKLDGHEVSAWFDEQCIHLARGKTARFAPSRQIVSWQEAAERIGKLLENGEYATNVELVETPGYERTKVAVSFWYLYHDLSEEAKSKGFLSSLQEIRGVGFPEETAELAKKLNDSQFRATLKAEYQSFLQAHNGDSSLLRFHYHKLERLAQRLEELDMPLREYQSSMTMPPIFRQFITDDEINESLSGGSGFSGGKARIYEYWQEGHSAKEKADFLKNEYGTGGHSHALSGASGSGEDHDSKGIRYTKSSCDKVQLSWTQVANRIDSLIKQERYFDKDALERYQQEQQVVEQDNPTEPEEWEQIDGTAIREALEQRSMEESPFVQQVMRDAEAIAAEEESYERFSMIETENGYAVWDDIRDEIYVDDEGISEEFTSEWQANDYLQEIKKAVSAKESAEWLYNERSKFEATHKSAYQVGDTVFLEGEAYNITAIGTTDVQLLPTRIVYPIYRAESKENFERLLRQDERNTRFVSGAEPEKTVAVSEPKHFIDHYYVVEDLQVRGALQLKEYSTFEDALRAYHELPSTQMKALGAMNTAQPLPGSLDFMQCKDGQDTIIEDYKKVAGWEHPEVLEAIRKLEIAIQTKEIPDIPAINFHISNDHLGEGGAKAKFRANMDAIRVLKELEFDGRNATPEEQEILSQYVGWGGLADAFDENKASWAEEFRELYAALSPQEYAAARASTLNAHYTSPTVIRAIYDAVGQMGFETGNILDPPYNTGNDFVYEDDFAQSTEEYMANSGQFDEEGNRLVKNLDSNGRFHTDWLNMIYPRLKIAKNLLTDDGVIFISIDDSEANNLKNICDEIFGATNFVSQLIWQNKKGGGNDSKYIAIEHEYILVYARNKTELADFYEAYSGNYIKRYKEKDKIGRFFWDTFKRKSGKQYYPIVCPDGTVLEYDDDGNPISWLRSKARFESDIKSGEVRIVKLGEKWSVQFKQRIPLGKTPRSIFTTETVLTEQGTTSNGSNDVYEYFKKDVFSNPKPVELIKFLLGFGLQKDDIILDFFSGSATTAEAVMRSNGEGKGCKYILVQVQENIDPMLNSASANAKRVAENAVSILDELNRPHIIPELAKERIRRAGKKIKEDSPLTTQSLDVGFRVLKCDTTNMKDVYYNPDEYDVPLIGETVDNIKSDRTPEDLLFQVMLDLGIELSSKIEEAVIGGKKVFDVADGFLIACFDANVTDETIRAVAQKQPYYFVMRDSSLANDSVATNFEQIFATYSPDTVRKVL